MTIALIILTSVISVYAFNNGSLFRRLLLNPYQVVHRREYWRLFTHGFIHADWIHLLVNMFVLFSFGIFTERTFAQLASYGYIGYPKVHYLLLYFGGIVVSSIPSVLKHRDHPWYNSVGASGAVSSVIFISIFFQPTNLIYFYFIPVPAILFGVIYLIYSQYMSRKSDQNINHDAHFYGAVFGFIYPLLIHPPLARIFLSQLGLG
jgi:membrane associated rhomboid family serine protease